MTFQLPIWHCDSFHQIVQFCIFPCSSRPTPELDKDTRPVNTICSSPSVICVPQNSDSVFVSLFIYTFPSLVVVCGNGDVKGRANGGGRGGNFLSGRPYQPILLFPQVTHVEIICYVKLTVLARYFRAWISLFKQLNCDLIDDLRTLRGV